MINFPGKSFRALVHGDTDAGQMSHANRFDRPRIVAPDATISRNEAIHFWADLVVRRCGSREICAVMFGVTFQTACNWFDGFSVPTGDKVLQAIAWWPDEFGLTSQPG